jgi:peptidoglycan/LPS O-acetylase OafA/YrhL
MGKPIRATGGVDLPLYLPELDGIRAFAVFLILAFHAMPGFTCGWVGVPLFFVLSGFLITGILLDSKGRCRTLDYFRVFYARRALRILPIYYLTLGVVILLAWRMEWPFADWPYYLAYLQNFIINWKEAGPRQVFPDFTIHTWSLAVEEQFYLLWPVAVLALSRAGLARLCVVLLALSVAFRYWSVAAYPNALFFYTLLPGQVDSLAAGSLAAVIVRVWPREKLVGPFTVYAAVAWAALASICAWGGAAHVTAPGLWFRAALPHAFATVVLFPVLLPHAPPSALCRLPPLRYVGRISYGLYLYHPIVFYFTGAALLRTSWGHQLSEPGHVVLELGLSFLIAGASWHLFESRVNRLKDRFRTSSPATEPVRQGQAGDYRTALAVKQDEAELLDLYPPKTSPAEMSGPNGGPIPLKEAPQAVVYMPDTGTDPELSKGLPLASELPDGTIELPLKGSQNCKKLHT